MSCCVCGGRPVAFFPCDSDHAWLRCQRCDEQDLSPVEWLATMVINLFLPGWNIDATPWFRESLTAAGKTEADLDAEIERQLAAEAALEADAGQ
jgi:hypothetical protein